MLILEVYAVLWVLGLYASLAAMPHRFEGEGVLLRYGAIARAFVPYSQIEAIERGRNEPSGPGSPGEGLRVVPEEDAACFAVGGRTDILLKLRDARRVEGFLRPTVPVTRVCFAADEPGEAARDLRRRVAASAGAPTAARETVT